MPNMPVLSQLENYLALTNKRETIITANMANIDTPGYRTQDMDFGRELASAMGADTSNDDSGNLHVHAHPVSGLLERADGNNVDMDRESMLLSQTQLQYGLGTQLMKQRFHQLLAAINGDK